MQCYQLTRISCAIMPVSYKTSPLFNFYNNSCEMKTLVLKSRFGSLCTHLKPKANNFAEREKIESLSRFAIDETAETMVRNYLQMKDNSNLEDSLESRIQF